MPKPTAPAAPAAPRNPLSPEQWVEAATALLVDKGVDSVRVDVVARQLGVTRGSFYWHFRDRDDLLQALLRQWRDTATEQLIERFEHRSTDPRVLVRELISLPFRGRAAERAAGIELAIRAWARRDRHAQHAVDEVDARRISYIAQCFSALGWSIAEARARGFALYAWEVGESMLGRQGSVAQRRERGALVEALLLPPEDA
ncbi:MAG: TetR/AcrR family transcriptional regulator [Rhizobacter sp.]|nr:TetR/AcrR family transcriptional regulator [Rhizobacter sp.]